MSSLFSELHYELIALEAARTHTREAEGFGRVFGLHGVTKIAPNEFCKVKYNWKNERFRQNICAASNKCYFVFSQKDDQCEGPRCAACS